VVFIYIKYTKEQKDLARSSNVADVLLRLGETVSTCGKEYVWESPQGLVTLHNNVWFNHYQQKGGDVIDFLKEFYDKNYIEALEFLLSEKINVCEKVEKPKQKNEFQIPKFSSSMKRVYGYLIKTRGIDSEIVNEFAKQGMIKESKDFHNALFIGYDNENNIKHIHQRGTYPGNSFKNNIEQSDNNYSFHWNGSNDKLYLFEAPIDMLSFISMNKNDWKKNNYASACSVSDRVLFQTLTDNPNIKKVYICFDNDKAGHLASDRIIPKLKELNYIAERLVPNEKDWNEDLLNEIEEMDVCQMEQLC
jgi:hypothetical protein